MKQRMKLKIFYLGSVSTRFGLIFAFGVLCCKMGQFNYLPQRKRKMNRVFSEWSPVEPQSDPQLNYQLYGLLLGIWTNFCSPQTRHKDRTKEQFQPSLACWTDMLSISTSDRLLTGYLQVNVQFTSTWEVILLEKIVFLSDFNFLYSLRG